MVFGDVVSDAVSIGAGNSGNAKVNSPIVFYRYAGIFSFIGLLFVTAFMNTAALRDFSNKYDQILFATPIDKFSYLGGRFFGSVVIATLPFLGIYLGTLAGVLTPWVDAEDVGAFQLLPMLQSFFVIVLPNVLFTGAILFGLAIAFRNSIVSFVGALVLIMAYSVSGTLLRDLDNQAIASLADPFALRTLSYMTKYWTSAELNNSLLDFSGVLLANRAIWIGMSLLVFGLTYWSFSFSATRKKGGKAGKKTSTSPAFKPVFVKLKALPQAVAQFDTKAQFTQFFNQIQIEWKEVVRSAPFIVIMILGVVNTSANLSFATQLYGTTTFPVTYSVIDIMRGGMYIFTLAIIAYYSGIMVWKERDAKMNEFFDASPFPSWIPFLSKLVAMTGIIFLIQFMLILVGVVGQTLMDYQTYELDVYFKSMILNDGSALFMTIVLSFFIQVLVNNKYLGYFIFIIYSVADGIIWGIWDISNVFRPFGVPSYTYSAMNEFGPFVDSMLAFNVYWLIFAVIVIIIGVLFFVRGKGASFAKRVELAKDRMDGKLKISLAILFFAWAGMGSWLFYNVHVLNEVTTSDEQEEQQVAYEKTYKKYEGINQPRITEVNYEIDLIPEERNFKAKTSFVAINKSDEPIEKFHFTMSPNFETEIEIAGATLEFEDENDFYRIYKLQSPLQPNEKLNYIVKSSYEPKGIQNQPSVTQIVENGTFISSFQFLPTIGYNSQFELGDKKDRKDNELPEKSRMPKLTGIDCGEPCNNSYISNSSDWVKMSATISTSPDQIAIAPGSLVKEWEKDGRKYFQYDLETPSLNFHTFVSGRYEVRRDKWNDSVDVEVYYHKPHEYNVEKMVKSVQNSLSYYSKNFTPYKHKQARIIEFPRYATFAQAFPGTMPYSESIGFIANLESEDEIDFVTYVVAHEMAHQWWAHQVVGANVQGATMLSESFSQYSALMVMEKTYGRDKMKKFLKHEMNGYLRARGTEKENELPIIYNEGQQYIHYNKASVLFYALRDFVGEDSVNKAMRQFAQQFAYKDTIYPNTLQFMQYLEKTTPDSLQYLLTDMFENITLYDNRALEATYKEIDSTHFEVTLKVQAEKLRADSTGNETAIPLNDWVDIGVYSAGFMEKDGKLIYKQREKLTEKETTFTFVVNKKPAKAGIDPDLILIDRIPSDNMKKVKLEEEAESSLEMR
jgi:ABC-2 type transport system permease protein